MTAAIAPGSSIVRLAISRPRALTASSAAANDSAPAATSAPYSPRLWPMTMSGAMPYAASSRVSAMSTVSTAGCVISVGAAPPRRARRPSASAGSTKMMSDSAPPLSSGAMIASASSNVSRDDRLAVAQARPACWRTASPGRCTGTRPCPAAPLPRKMPRARSAFQAAGSPDCERLERELGLGDQLGAVGVVDGDRARARAAPPRSAAPARGGGPAAPRPARSRSSLASAGLVGGAEHERAAQRRLRGSPAAAARSPTVDRLTAIDGRAGRWS